MERKNQPAKYKWNFDHLYRSPSAWKADLDRVSIIVDQICNLEGKLHEFGSFKKLEMFSRKIEKISEKLAQYLHLGDIDTTNTVFIELEGLLQAKSFMISQKLIFIPHEIKGVGESKIMGFLQQDPQLQPLTYHYQLFFKKQVPHMLSLSQEKLLVAVARSRGAIDELYSTLAYADKKPIFITYQGKKQMLSPALYREIMENTACGEQQFRMRIAKRYTQQIVDKKHSLAKVYEGQIFGSVEEVKLRKYRSCLQAALNGDDVTVAFYQNLIKYGKKHAGIVGKYERLKKQYFGFKTYYRTDSGLKLSTPHQQDYTVNDAQRIIKTALKPLGQRYQALLAVAWADYKVDYFADTNKRDGAYSSGGSEVNPIILMNWDNSIRSVTTLAHEIGHSVHSLISNDAQPIPLNQYPIILAEVASTLNEHLLYDYLLKTTTDTATKVYLLQNRIDDLIGTFFRQINFAEFENDIHQLVEKQVPITADKLADHFSKLSDQYNDGAFDKPKHYTKPYGWPRILHFFEAPFYVYKYATSVVASFKLYQDAKQGNNNLIFKLLEAGGHKAPLAILVDSGVRFDQDQIYQNLVDYLNNLLDKLAVNLKKMKN